MLQKLLRFAEQAELFEVDSEATQIGFEANQMKTFNVEETRGMAARVVVNGRLGFAASTILDRADDLVEDALESARYGEEVPLCFPEPQLGPQVQVYDARLAEMPIARLVELGQEIIALIREKDEDAMVNVRLERRVQRMAVRNSAGNEVTVTRTPFSIQLMVQRVRGDDVLILFDHWDTALLEEDLLEMPRRVARKLELARRPAQLASGRMPVLFSPSGATMVLLPLIEGLNGREVYRRTSPLAGRVGEAILSPLLTLVDDPTLDGRPGSASHDDEGVPHRRTMLVEAGVLRGFIYDLKTAAQAGVEPTGNGGRGLFSPPAPDFSNLVLLPGDRPVEEMIAGVEEGLLVESPLGLGQGNILSGAFANNLGLAFKIERGEIVGRVKDVSVAGNVYEDLYRVQALSRESEWVFGGLRLPYVLVDGLNVVTKGG